MIQTQAIRTNGRAVKWRIAFLWAVLFLILFWGLRDVLSVYASVYRGMEISLPVTKRLAMAYGPAACLILALVIPGGLILAELFQARPWVRGTVITIGFIVILFILMVLMTSFTRLSSIPPLRANQVSVLSGAG